MALQLALSSISPVYLNAFVAPCNGGSTDYLGRRNQCADIPPQLVPWLLCSLACQLAVHYVEHDVEGSH